MVAQIAVRVQIVAGIVQEGLRRRLEQARRKPLADQPALAVASVRVEAVAHDAAAVALDIRDDGDERQIIFEKSM